MKIHAAITCGCFSSNMADNTTPNADRNFRNAAQNTTNGEGNSQRAIQLLQQATMLLSSPASSSSPRQETNTAVQPCTNTSTTCSLTPTSSLRPSTPSLHGTQSVLQNLRTIFSPYARATVSQASAYQRAQRPKLSYKPYYPAKETWTHDFFCLGKCAQNRVPSRSDKIALQNCGLGRRKICFSSKANYSKMEEKLFEVYPKLSDGGGFQILRTGAGGHSSSLSAYVPCKNSPATS